MLKALIEIPFRMLLVATVMTVGYLIPATLLYFPRDVGLVELEPIGGDDGAAYYDSIYGDKGGDGSDSGDSDYVEFGKEANQGYDIPEAIAQFVEEYALHNAKTLEVGAGSGQLQDIVSDYTGLDIAPSAARYFHKPFIQGSATDIPVEDNSYDMAWTVWTLEHVPNPERAMEELRRVVRPGGTIYFFPAWNCVPWAATGLQQRPYESLSFGEKIEKASLALRSNFVFRASYPAPVRALRYGYWRVTGSPTRLRYTALAPNYQHYWMADADATASIDSAEAMLWFLSRGDECLNCPSTLGGVVMMPYMPLHIRIRK